MVRGAEGGSACGAAMRTSGSGSAIAALIAGSEAGDNSEPAEARRSPARSPAGFDRGSIDRAAVRHRRLRSARHGVRCRNAASSAGRSDTSRRRSSRPIRRAVGVALGARVRRADRHRQVGARNAHAVIAPVVDDHVILRRHMAVDALRAGAAGRMMMMRSDVELFRQVALGAQSIALGTQLCGVRFMTVRAGDPGGMHAALQERAVFVHLAVDLPVGVIMTRYRADPAEPHRGTERRAPVPWRSHVVANDRPRRCRAASKPAARCGGRCRSRGSFPNGRDRSASANSSGPSGHCR